MAEALEPLVRKLSHGARLTDEDQGILQGAFHQSVRVAARQNLIREGEPPVNVHLVLEGYACRYKILPDGTRQIVALLLPGDFCDLHVAILHHMDHTISTLTRCRIARLDRRAALDLATRTPTLMVALWWATLVDEAVLREWLAGMGRRSADKQIAHLFCELLVRLRAAGLAAGDGYDFPLSQNDLADILGLTPVHVNRMLQQLRTDGLITLSERRLCLPDLARLQDFAGFNPNYLHLNQTQGVVNE